MIPDNICIHKMPNEKQISSLRIMGMNNRILSSYMINDNDYLIIKTYDNRKSVVSRKWSIDPKGGIRPYVKSHPDFIDIDEFEI